MLNIMKQSFTALRPRDKRAIVFGVAAAAAIGVYLLVLLPVVENWSEVRGQLHTYRDRLDDVSVRTPGDQAKIAGLYTSVPFVELPQKEDVQRKLFWDRSYEQLKAVGINITAGPAYVAAAGKNTNAGYRSLRLKFTGTCKYEQLVNYLAKLNENPYLVSIEEIVIKRDDQQPEQVKIDITLTTFVK